MRYLSFFLFSISCCHLFATSVLNKITDKYERPITILYISNEPKPLTTREDDIIVYWTTNKEFSKNLNLLKPKNCILLGGNISDTKMSYLAKVSHFDIAIIDVKQEDQAPLFDYHFSDHIFFQSTNLRYEHTPKDKIFQTKLGITNAYTTYAVESNYQTKHLISQNRMIPWLPGLSLRDFFLLEGAYPNENTILTQIVELYTPGVSADYKPRNMILQGTKLKIIDYNPKSKFSSLLEDTHIQNNFEKIKRYKILSKLLF